MRAQEALTRAIEKADGVKALAAKLGCRDTVVYMWVARATETTGVPRDKCPAVERVTGVPVEELCPDSVWRRTRDADWPHPKGRPLLDLAAPKVAA